MSRFAEGVSEQMSLLHRLRQHHGIEHATVTLLNQRLPGVQIVARSDLDGFVIVGELSRETLTAAVEEALGRLRAGERHLTVHPHCGTNLAAAGVLSGVAALAAGSGERRSLWWERLPGAILAATLALMIAPAVGRWLQEHVTTSSQVAGLRIARIERVAGSPVTAYRVVIAPAEAAP